MSHVSVLLHEAIEGLQIQEGDVVVDGTLGGGGHTEEMVRMWNGKIRVIGIDRDIDALQRVEERLGSSAHVTYVEGSFRNIDTILDSLQIQSVQRILLDIGLSSDQFDISGRGFSFQKNEPLLMTFKKNPGPDDITAQSIINEWEEENIYAIIRNYGEEKFARRIASAIVSARKIKPITTTFELSDIIKNATPAFYHRQKIHPATRTFQALRITVNDEIESLKDGLRKGFERLSSSGRLAVISFHSLEDREVKNFFKQVEDESKGKRITKKPLVATEEEIANNPRS
jgi:16S rRNA (cytosine1402-N4)-methyltransferase